MHTSIGKSIGAHDQCTSDGISLEREGLAGIVFRCKGSHRGISAGGTAGKGGIFGCMLLMRAHHCLRLKRDAANSEDRLVVEQVLFAI